MSDNLHSSYQPIQYTGKLFCTVLEAVQVTGASSYSIRHGVRSGKIPHIRSGNKYLINMKLFLELLDEISQTGGSIDE